MIILISLFILFLRPQGLLIILSLIFILILQKKLLEFIMYLLIHFNFIINFFIIIFY